MSDVSAKTADTQVCGTNCHPVAATPKCARDIRGLHVQGGARFVLSTVHNFRTTTTLTLIPLMCLTSTVRPTVRSETHQTQQRGTTTTARCVLSSLAILDSLWCRVDINASARRVPTASVTSDTAVLSAEATSALC